MNELPQICSYSNCGTTIETALIRNGQAPFRTLAERMVKGSILVPPVGLGVGLGSVVNVRNQPNSEPNRGYQNRPPRNIVLRVTVGTYQNLEFEIVGQQTEQMVKEHRFKGYSGLVLKSRIRDSCTQ
ncbi:hypothetical protein AVEN_234365-1 [Araneus ventricosus]|uniref:Uncharacterized protein n=1 Tax=Araneus ventricosus TaxID=182803 RepID=A0A4Y2A926_ARAVE|nr:hypothetical protein AVEN_234365-1 [Araneus ventricosus]